MDAGRRLFAVTKKWELRHRASRLVRKLREMAQLDETRQLQLLISRHPNKVFPVRRLPPHHPREARTRTTTSGSDATRAPQADPTVSSVTQATVDQLIRDGLLDHGLVTSANPLINATRLLNFLLHSSRTYPTVHQQTTNYEVASRAVRRSPYIRQDSHSLDRTCRQYYLLWQTGLVPPTVSSTNGSDPIATRTDDPHRNPRPPQRASGTQHGPERHRSQGQASCISSVTRSHGSVLPARVNKAHSTRHVPNTTIPHGYIVSPRSHSSAGACRSSKATTKARKPRKSEKTHFGKISEKFSLDVMAALCIGIGIGCMMMMFFQHNHIGFPHSGKISK